MAQDERALNWDLPGAVADAAEEGDVDAVRDWLAAGGAPDAKNDGSTLLEIASSTSRPSCASVVAILCAAGASTDGRSLAFAALHGAVDSVRVLLRYGANPNQGSLNYAVLANQWQKFTDPWSIARAQAAASTGHQGIVRLLLKHGAAVNARTGSDRFTPLMVAANYSGFLSLGVVRELLRGRADLNLVNAKGRNAEAIARKRLSIEVRSGQGIPHDMKHCRRPGSVEAFLALLAEVRAAGSWKRYVNAPRIDVIVLQRLCAAGRASPPPALARLFPTKSPPLPKELVWLILKFWRSDRDP